MTARARCRPARGTTVIEVMVAAAVLLVSVVGLAAVMGTAARATATGHRRTVIAFARQELVDRLAVTPRDQLAALSGAALNTWMVAGCYDVESREKGSANASFDPAFACPEGTSYRTWMRIEPAPTTLFAGARGWRARVYAERVDPGCSEDDRYSSSACAAADLMLTD